MVQLCWFLFSTLEKEYLAAMRHRYMLLGTDAEESAPVVRQYIKVLVQDLEYLESKVFNIKVSGVQKKIEFRVGLAQMI